MGTQRKNTRGARAESDQAAEDRPALSLLRDIRAGLVSGATLDLHARRDVIGALRAQGASESEIASALSVSDRTVQRDIAHLRRENAARITPEFVEEVVGEYIAHCRSAVSRLDRIGSSGNGSEDSRINATIASVKVLDVMIRRLQLLGWLPHAPSERRATHGPSAIHLHNHPRDSPSEHQAMAALGSAAENLDRLATLAARSTDGDDAKVARRARAAAKRVKNTADAARRAEE